MIKKLALTAFFLAATTIMAYGGASDLNQKEALTLVKNRLASTKDRLKALEALKPGENPEVLTDLLNIIRNLEEPITLRAPIMDILTQSNDPWATAELKKILRDSSVPPENRILALYALWKKEPQKMRTELMNLAQNNNESQDLRVAALNYLRIDKGEWPPRFWEDLFLKKENPATVRIQAMNGMKELGLITQLETTLISIIKNPSEPFEFRKSVVLTANSTVASEVLEKALMFVLSKSENSLEMRRFALDNLPLKPSEALLPELKQVLSQEKDPILIEGLKTLIESTTPKKES